MALTLTGSHSFGIRIDSFGNDEIPFQKVLGRRIPIFLPHLLAPRRDKVLDEFLQFGGCSFQSSTHHRTQVFACAVIKIVLDLLENFYIRCASIVNQSTFFARLSIVNLLLGNHPGLKQVHMV